MNLNESVQTWNRAAERLEQVRREDIRATSTIQAVLNLSDACDYALRTNPPRTTSGLVIQQQIFQRLRPKS